jgi:hypothetical protein
LLVVFTSKHEREMQMSHFIIVGIRKNVDGKPDYLWTSKWSNGCVKKYATPTEADEAIERLSDSKSFPMYGLQKIQIKGLPR